MISMVMVRLISSYHTAMVVKVSFSGTTARAASIRAPKSDLRQYRHEWASPVISMATAGSIWP